ERIKTSFEPDAPTPSENPVIGDEDVPSVDYLNRLLIAVAADIFLPQFKVVSEDPDTIAPSSFFVINLSVGHYAADRIFIEVIPLD
ncbi:hypothetical protein, partial [Bacillus licheniformis]|uniref:hypothetical protein n=1 Tax=Bacillus licheniformis TaxID=1402 RepID=UPI00227F8258